MNLRLVLCGLAAATVVGPLWGAAALAAPSVESPAAPQTVEPKPTKVRKSVRAEAKPASTAPSSTAGPAANAEPAAEPSATPARRPRGRRVAKTLPPSRPAEAGATPATPDPAQPIGPTNWFASFFGLPAAQPRGTLLPAVTGRGQIDALIAHYAKLNGVPESLVHRIVIRESKYNPRAVGRGGAMGLMQIKTATARGMGYQGGPAGLLDAETNLMYAVKYLAGAYKTADGNHDRAVSHYARGYYYAARAKGLTPMAARSGRGRRGTQEADASAGAPAETPAATPSFFSFASRTTASPIEERAGR